MTYDRGAKFRPKENPQSDALEALDRLSSYAMVDIALDLDYADKDRQTIRAALTQSAEKDAAIRDLAKDLEYAIGCLDEYTDTAGIIDDLRITLKTHAEAIKRAEKED